MTSCHFVRSSMPLLGRRRSAEAQLRSQEAIPAAKKWPVPWNLNISEHILTKWGNIPLNIISTWFYVGTESFSHRKLLQWTTDHETTVRTVPLATQTSKRLCSAWRCWWWLLLKVWNWMSCELQIAKQLECCKWCPSELAIWPFLCESLMLPAVTDCRVMDHLWLSIALIQYQKLQRVI